MADDFTLAPDEDDGRPERARPVRLVSSGLAPTAAVPTNRRSKDTPPAYSPCLLCGREVLSGQTTHGQTLHLDPSQRCFCVTWLNSAPAPTFVPSRAYVVHQCVSQGV